jgi:16S rRNA A1518/A1519 N6-dimethyltransferase RsmA/KsgA/DIM1 with predicted DNA glycosylase/AP lyase activity
LPSLALLARHAQSDTSVVKAALSAAGVAPGDRVLEIGPGTGILTAALLAAGARVTALEKDAALAAALADNNADLVASGALTVVHDDVLRWLRNGGAAAAFPDSSSAAAAPSTASGAAHAAAPLPPPLAKVVANIPYAISTELLSALLPRGGAFSVLVLLVQEELAQRLVVAQAGASDAREMSLRVRFYAAPRYVRFVSRAAFTPPPRVDSAVVAFSLARPQAWPLRPGARTAAFFGFMRAAFASRRKMLRKTLAARPGATGESVAAALAAAGAAPDVRPQELALPQFLSLFNALEPDAGDAPTQARGEGAAGAAAAAAGAAAAAEGA